MLTIKNSFDKIAYFRQTIFIVEVLQFSGSLISTVAMKALIPLIVFQVLRVITGNPITGNITQSNEVDLSWRLPTAIYPINYKIELDTDVHHDGARDYAGTVSITMGVLEATSRIILHAKELVLSRVLLFEGVANVETTHRLDAERDFLIIEATDNFEPGSDLLLYIEFTGSLQLSGVGFYRSQYEIDGSTRYLATTQFEATYARYAFPVFDGI